MTSTWWAITTAAAFGQFTLAWRLREFGALTVASFTANPGLALTAQAAVLYFAGTTLAGTTVSVAAGTAVLFVAERFRRAREARDEIRNQED